MLKRGVCAVVLAGLLASCGADQGEDTNLPLVLLGSAREIVAARRAGPPQVTVVTPEMLAQTTSAALQVNPEVKGGSDFLRRVAARDDSTAGRVEVWKSSDNAQIFLRDGIVVGTRGIGGDIIAANANVTVRAVNGGADGRGVRSYTVSDGDTTSTVYQFSCEIRNLGSEKISVVNLVFLTDHMREDCVGGPDGVQTIRNDYWVHMPTGTVRKSRQWIGPRVGYFELLLLKN
jgi:hypothetical protein